MPNSKWTRVILLWLVAAVAGQAQEHPKVELSNGVLRATIYLPDATTGFYRGTRFDWAGMFASLEYKGHNYFGPFYEKFDPAIADVVVADLIVAGTNSAASGPVEEFMSPDGSSLGYSDAKPGQPFYKIGVGVLEKPMEEHYSSFQHYSLLSPGQRRVEKGKDWVEFSQRVDGGPEHSYIYRKTIRFEKNKPVMILEHSLENTGRKSIDTEVYDHNFLSIDRQTVGPRILLTFAFPPKATASMEGFAEIRGNQIAFLKPLQGSDILYTPIEGMSDSAKDYNFRVENRETGAGVWITGDRPMTKFALWAVRTVVAPEPFIRVKVEPGQIYRWSYKYEFYETTRVVGRTTADQTQ